MSNNIPETFQALKKNRDTKEVEITEITNPGASVNLVVHSLASEGYNVTGIQRLITAARLAADSGIDITIHPVFPGTNVKLIEGGIEKYNLNNVGSEIRTHEKMSFNDARHVALDLEGQLQNEVSDKKTLTVGPKDIEAITLGMATDDQRESLGLKIYKHSENELISSVPRTRLKADDDIVEGIKSQLNRMIEQTRQEYIEKHYLGLPKGGKVVFVGLNSGKTSDGLTASLRRSDQAEKSADELAQISDDKSFGPENTARVFAISENLTRETGILHVPVALQHNFGGKELPEEFKGKSWDTELDVLQPHLDKHGAKIQPKFIDLDRDFMYLRGDLDEQLAIFQAAQELMTENENISVVFGGHPDTALGHLNVASNIGLDIPFDETAPRHPITILANHRQPKALAGENTWAHWGNNAGQDSNLLGLTVFNRPGASEVLDLREQNRRSVNLRNLVQRFQENTQHVVDLRQLTGDESDYLLHNSARHFIDQGRWNDKGREALKGWMARESDNATVATFIREMTAVTQPPGGQVNRLVSPNRQSAAQAYLLGG